MSELRATRRLMLRLLAGGLGVGLFPSRGLGQNVDPAFGGEAGAKLRGAFPGASQVVAIGHQFVSEHPEEADLAGLLASLKIDVDQLSATSPDEIAALRARLCEDCERDFREGRTQTLGGWILSQSELRLAALLTLSR